VEIEAGVCWEPIGRKAVKEGNSATKVYLAQIFRSTRTLRARQSQFGPDEAGKSEIRSSKSERNATVEDKDQASNKPNSRRAEMYVTPFNTNGYVNLAACWGRRKQSQSRGVPAEGGGPRMSNKANPVLTSHGRESTPSAQNKANLGKAETDVNSFGRRDYEDLTSDLSSLKPISRCGTRKPWILSQYQQWALVKHVTQMQFGTNAWHKWHISHTARAFWALQAIFRNEVTNAPGRTRTCNLRIRSPRLCPIELRAR
jgi:hypothetical protein